jgi:hypothetical protein
MLFCFVRVSTAQEMLVGIQVNPALEHSAQHQKFWKSAQAVDTISLPFFDDFSYPQVYPDPFKWSDNHVFINTSYPVLPVSLGVATFDILDSTGVLYQQAGTQVFLADALTSQPIDLALPVSDSIYLSFFYQAQGLGDAPERGDSLVLEFFSPSENTWTRVWSKQGETLHPFRQVMIPVSNPMYLEKGFRFRFKNYGSLSRNVFNPGAIGNSDHWHIDYVLIDKDRSLADTTVRDVSFVQPLRSLLNTYESLPWEHFLIGRLTEMGSRLPQTYRNNDAIVRNVSRAFLIRDLENGQIVRSFSGGAENLSPGQLREYSPDLAYTFASAAIDSASFEVKAFLTTDAFDKKENDTVVYTQRFHNYYAYDDGSAENGYGISGLGSANASLAVRFRAFRSDTLRAVNIFFNRSLNEASRKEFLLTIWSDNNGKPGEILYQQQNVRPEYAEGLNHFYTYLLDSVFVTPLIFYVGWEQMTSDFLNVGFDVNRNNSSQIFYNLDGEWKNTSFEGSIMIRPVVSNQPLPVGIPHNPSLMQLRVFPNPTPGILYTDLDPELIRRGLTLSVFNIRGSLVMNTVLHQNFIDLSHLPDGIYLIRLSGSGSFTYSNKVILSR